MSAVDCFMFDCLGCRLYDVYLMLIILNCLFLLWSSDQQKSRKAEGDEFVSDGEDSEGGGSGAEEGAPRGKKRRREAKGCGSSSESGGEEDKPSAKKTKQRRPPRSHYTLSFHFWTVFCAV